MGFSNNSSSGALQTFTKIETKTLSASASADFTGLSSTYKYFLLVGHVTGNQAGAMTVSMRINNDSGANYNYTEVSGTTVATTTGSTSIPLNNAGLNNANSSLINVTLGVAALGSSNLHSIAGPCAAQTTTSTFLKGSWAGAGAISQITIYPSASTLTGEITLYGIRSA